MPAPTPKSDQRRALQEAKWERQYGKGAPKAAPASEKIAIARAAVDNEVDKKRPLSTKNAEHQEKWRKANPELHRERARNSMRKLRGKTT